MSHQAPERFRIHKILSGASVVLITLAFESHLVNHILVETSHQPRGPAVWAGIAFVVAIGILSLIGGFLLLRKQP